jgi:hypothetical protein
MMLELNLRRTGNSIGAVLHEEVLAPIGVEGGLCGVRDPALLDAAVARPKERCASAKSEKGSPNRTFAPECCILREPSDRLSFTPKLENDRLETGRQTWFITSKNQQEWILQN